MYSDKENIGILTSLLKSHGKTTAVVCPGSRNAPIAHNFTEAGMECHAVTDERSAGFVALGLFLARRKPIAICVTSGSAMLNLAPAIAEAAYRDCGLVVVTADRPVDRIGQLDGQTIEQHGALGCHSAISVTLPEPHDDKSRRYCQRLVNEALIKCKNRVVHINVPISEPLFGYTKETLPEIEKISLIADFTSDSEKAAARIAERIEKSKRPMIVVGQTLQSQEFSETLRCIGKRVVLLHEVTASADGAKHFDEVIYRCGDDPSLMPDFILHIGETFVSKRLKIFLTDSPDAETWRISPDGEIHDTFSNQSGLICGESAPILKALSKMLDAKHLQSEFFKKWQRCLEDAETYSERFTPEYSQMLAVKTFEREIGDATDCIVHYGNSSAIRLANLYARHYVNVNRGVNGIEGSLSTAAGHSLGTGSKCFCVIGDLSFFYDNNALWNDRLKGNFRILLLNNNGGSIFRMLRGMPDDETTRRQVMGSHSANAEGICSSYGVSYDAATDASQLEEKIDRLINSKSNRPMLLEVFTDPDADTRQFKKYYTQYKLWQQENGKR